MQIISVLLPRVDSRNIGDILPLTNDVSLAIFEHSILNEMYGCDNLQANFIFHHWWWLGNLFLHAMTMWRQSLLYFFIDDDQTSFILHLCLAFFCLLFSWLPARLFPRFLSRRSSVRLQRKIRAFLFKLIILGLADELQVSWSATKLQIIIAMQLLLKRYSICVALLQ